MLAERRVGVIGANGSGKSTLARLLNGLVVPDRGRVHVDGLDTRTRRRSVRRRVGFVFTDPDAQIVMPTVAEDVAFSSAPRPVAAGRAWPRGCARARRLRPRRARRPPGAPALGRREAAARALRRCSSPSPTSWCCDEPTTLLDLRNARRVAALLDGLRAAGGARDARPRPARGVRPGARLRRGPGRRATTRPRPAIAAYRRLVGVSGPRARYLRAGHSPLHRARPARSSLGAARAARSCSTLVRAAVGGRRRRRVALRRGAAAVARLGVRAAARARLRRCAGCCCVLARRSRSGPRARCARSSSSARCWCGRCSPALVTLTTRDDGAGRRPRRAGCGRCARSGSTRSGSGSCSRWRSAAIPVVGGLAPDVARPAGPAASSARRGRSPSRSSSARVRYADRLGEALAARGVGD